MKEIYLDNSATTRISEAALEEYVRVSRECFGNPSSLHKMGFDSESVIKDAKESVIRSLGAKGASVIFTASGSEANNLAVIGRALSKERYKRGAKIMVTEGEHASVEECCRSLEKSGYKVARIPTTRGRIDMDRLRAELTPDLILVSMMLVNNETGAFYDTAAVSSLVNRVCPDAFIHIDATQAYLKIPFTQGSVGADMITISSHKISGPKGVGALVVSDKVIKARGLSPVILGGGQGGGLRSGTENVPGIAAFAKAVDEGFGKCREVYAKCNALRDYLLEKLNTLPSLSEISPTLPDRHAPHILNITLPKIKSETMLHYLSSRGIFVSSGSACSSNTHHTSSALIAYGRSESEADCSIRISFNYTNEREDVDELCTALTDGLSKLARIR